MNNQRRLSPLSWLAFLALGAGCGSQTTVTTNTAAPSSSAPATKSATVQPAAVDNVPAPVRKPPAGLGNAIGRVLYNDQGVPGIEVRLCENISFVGGCGGETFQSKTNKDGYYVVDKVKPGEYAVAVRVFNTDKFIYPTSGVLSAAKFKVNKDESLAVRTVNLWKTDLQVEEPKNGATVKTGTPSLKWKSYPAAANYKVTLRTKEGIGSLTNQETAEATLKVEKALLNGSYEWKVEAFNAAGTKLAETPADASFTVTGQTGSNEVKLVTPAASASVAAGGVKLTWKPNPVAEEYRVYLKGVKADQPVLSFEAMQGTSWQPSSPLPADTYFWSVEAWKGSERVAGSSLQRFTVK